MKLLNNFVSLGYAAIYAEALALASKVGISPERFDSVIRGSRMDCGFYQTFMGYTIEGNRESHKFTISNAFKDLTYLESMADAAKLVNPIGNAIKNSFRDGLRVGWRRPRELCAASAGICRQAERRRPHAQEAQALMAGPIR